MGRPETDGTSMGHMGHWPRSLDHRLRAPRLGLSPLPLPAFPASPIAPVIRSPRRRSMDRAENHFGPMSPTPSHCRRAVPPPQFHPSHRSRRPCDLDPWNLGFPKDGGFCQMPGAGPQDLQSSARHAESLGIVRICDGRQMGDSLTLHLEAKDLVKLGD